MCFENPEGPGEEPKLLAWTVVRMAYIFQRTPTANVLSNARYVVG